MQRHNYRVVNPIRFFIFILISVLIIAFSFISIINRNSAEAASVNTYIQVVVQDSDNLWSIAEDYCDRDHDIRELVNDICETNDIDSNEYLQPGDIIFVPLY